MMWSEVNICQRDKTDSIKTTFSVMDQWVEFQFTINHHTNCLISPLFSCVHSTQQHVLSIYKWAASFYRVLFFSVKCPSFADYDPTLHCLLGFPNHKLCSLSIEVGRIPISGKTFVFARVFCHCWPRDTVKCPQAKACIARCKTK